MALCTPHKQPATAHHTSTAQRATKAIGACRLVSVIFQRDARAFPSFSENQSGNGSDFGDWATGPTPQVQDAFGTPGASINLGPNERTALDVIGYNLVPVPEPGIGALLLGGLTAIGILRRRALSSPHQA